MADKIVPARLLSCIPQPTSSWHEFLERWNKAVADGNMFAMLGMLHEGMNVTSLHNKYNEPEYRRADIIIFYLQTADGWTDDDILALKEEGFEKPFVYGTDKYGNNIRRSAREMRQIVAKKAFDILCQKYFRLECDERDLEERQESQILYIFREEDLFKALISFFRLRKGWYGGDFTIPNLPYRHHEISHPEKLARAFLLRFIFAIWAWVEVEIYSHQKEDERAKSEKYNMEMRALVEDAKLWSIEVLHFLGEIGKLNSWHLSDCHMEKVREIAMRSKISFGGLPSRPVETLDEACLVNSKSAIWLRNYLLDRKEAERLQAIADEERVRKETERQEAKRLQAIADAKRAKDEAEKVLAELGGKK